MPGFSVNNTHLNPSWMTQIFSLLLMLLKQALHNLKKISPIKNKHCPRNYHQGTHKIYTKLKRNILSILNTLGIILNIFISKNYSTLKTKPTPSTGKTTLKKLKRMKNKRLTKLKGLKSREILLILMWIKVTRNHKWSQLSNYKISHNRKN